MKKILVYADWNYLGKPMLMGELCADLLRGEEIFSFKYDKTWLQSKFSQDLDPDLKLFQGPQYLNDQKSNFGLFLDSSPDRYGRTLMKRRESILAKKENRSTKKLLESDFLLGVNDATRMGGLRFKTTQEGYFLNADEKYSTPPFSSIRELEQASLNLEDDKDAKDEEEWLKLLLQPGSSLGGARPKANVKHPDGSLWIAKFPSKQDDKNSGLWEYFANQLAASLEINVAEATAKKYSQKQHTYLSKRFDRKDISKRIHYASAMTLLGYKDGKDYKDGCSYLELVHLLERYGASVTEDTQELWRRIVFSVAISNSDDHLRNHGFLLTRAGWRLSPAFDINPNEQAYGLSLNISESDNTLDYNLCLSVAEYFRVDHEVAKKYISKTKKKVKGWHTLADKLQILKREQSMMEAAFRF